MKRRGWWMVVLLVMSSLALMACGGDEPAVEPAGKVAKAEVPADEARLDEHRTLGKPIEVENLTVWPVYTDAPIDVGEFLTLQEAQAKKVAVVRELGGGEGNRSLQLLQRALQERARAEGNDNDPNEPGVGQIAAGQDEGATVNRVVVENKGDLPILVCAGTIIQGGQQDRQIGQDFVIAAGKTVEVDAFCVEQGRWALQTLAEHEGMAERSGGDAEKTAVVKEFASFRVAPKSVRVAGQYKQDQGEVWARVRISNNLSGCSIEENDSDTLFGAIALADEKTKAQRAKIESAITAAFETLFASDRKPVGFAYAISGKPVNVRIFAHERILKSQLPTFLMAMAMEAQLDAADVKTETKPAKASDVIAFMRAVEGAQEKQVETRASNFNGYASNEIGYKARCYLKSGAIKPGGRDKIVITEDWTAK